MAELFERLMALHNETFSEAYYNTSYHLLAAALHYAADTDNLDQVAMVSVLARERLAWLDIHAPRYEHSSLSAEGRGNISIYAMLARQAEGRAVVLQHKQYQETRNTALFHAQDSKPPKRPGSG